MEALASLRRQKLHPSSAQRPCKSKSLTYGHTSHQVGEAQIGNKGMTQLPNPAIDAFKSKLTSQTSLNDAMILGRDQFKKTLASKASLFSRWRSMFGYICAIVCLWTCLHVVEVARLLPGDEESDKAGDQPSLEAVLMLFIKHIGSAIILFLLGIAPHLNVYQDRVKSVVLGLGLLELLTAVGGMNIVNEDLLALKALRKLGHYPFGGILAILGYLQDLYMNADMKRSRERFRKLDENLRAMAKPKKS